MTVTDTRFHIVTSLACCPGVKLQQPFNQLHTTISHTCTQYMCSVLFGLLLLFCVLVTSMVISRWALTCVSANSWQLYSASPLGDQMASTMISYIPSIMSWTQGKICQIKVNMQIEWPVALEQIVLLLLPDLLREKHALYPFGHVSGLDSAVSR